MRKARSVATLQFSPKTISNFCDWKFHIRQPNPDERTKKSAASEIAQHYIKMGDTIGWFEALYSRAKGDTTVISWTDIVPNPNLVPWPLTIEEFDIFSLRKWL